MSSMLVLTLTFNHENTGDDDYDDDENIKRYTANNKATRFLTQLDYCVLDWGATNF